MGVLVGCVVGWAGGRLLEQAAARDWATDTTQRLSTIALSTIALSTIALSTIALSTIALAAVAYADSEASGGNGFVAAFTAGLVVGTTARSLLPRTTGFAEADGQLLTLVTFLLFGSVVVADVLGDLDWRILVYAVASLLVVRPLAVAVALLGSKVRPSTTGFIGWAGPRGLASIVYAVLMADSGIPAAAEVVQVAAWPSS